MLDPNNIPPVADDELLARFIVNSNEKRDDGSVRPNLFLPYKLTALSVTRHRETTDQEIWNIGRQVAAQRVKTLYGRADIRASSCRIEPLDVVESWQVENPNHADIVGYPPRKDEQLSLAEKLAAAIEGSWIGTPSDQDGSGVTT